MNRLVLIYTILSSDHTKQNACALSDLIFKNIPYKDTCNDPSAHSNSNTDVGALDSL